MQNLNTKKITLSGLFIALVTVGTMVIQVPVPLTEGYINLGDGFILTIAYLFGGYYAFIAGGIGSALADILSGYAHWAIPTFIIKGLMGYVAAKLFSQHAGVFGIKNISAVLAAEIIMVAGYLAAGTFLSGGFAVSLTSVPSNMLQGVFAFAVYFVLAKSLEKAAKNVILN